MPRDPRPIRTIRCAIDPLESRQLLAAELISNGKFANDSADWAITGNFRADDTYSTFRSGPGYAYLAGSDGTLATSSNLTGTLQQTIALPSTTATANLTFYYRTATEDGTAQADSLAVRIRNTAGTVLQTLTTLYNQSLSSYVVSPVFNLASYTGQTVVLSFEGATNASAGTVFRIDDVSLQATSSIAPTIPAPTLAYPGVPTTTGLPVVNTPVPGFIWNSVSGATGYGITLEKLVSGTTYTNVFDSDTNANTSGRPLRGTNFTVPLTLTAGTYRWTLRAYDDAVTMTSDAPPLYFNLATGGYVRALGADVSHFQNIAASAWPTIKTNGTTSTTDDDISFVWAKASQGVSAPDNSFDDKAIPARAAGVPIAGYHYATPNNGGTTIASMTADAIAEANDFFSRMSFALLPGNLVPMLDFEDPAVTQNQTLLSHWVNAFCDRITALTNVTPVVYTGQFYGFSHLNSSVLRYPVWIAQYPGTIPNPQTAVPSDPDGSGPRTSTSPWTSWDFWQYTSSGTLAGYTGNVDRNSFNGDVAALEPYKIQPTTLYTITGTVFEDADGDGTRDAGEIGIAGRTVFLDADGDGVIDAGERTAVTNAGGVYNFTNTLQGNYQLRQIVPGTSLATTAAAQSFKLAAGVTNVAHDFGSRVIDAMPPTLATSRFDYDVAARTITLVFSEAVNASQLATAATLTNLTAGNTAVAFTVMYNAATLTAVFSPTTLPLVDGDYRLTLPTGTVTDAASNANAMIDVDFFSLNGDIDRDRAVGFSDLVILAQNYNTGTTYAQGDLTGDGAVDFADLITLAQSYNNTLPPLLIARPAAIVATTKTVTKKRPTAGVLV